MVNLAAMFILVASARPIFSGSFNVTVDDKFGPFPQHGSAIQFGEGWFDNDVATCGESCEGIVAFKTAFNSTWKRSTYNRSNNLDMPKTASLSFKGTAVYVNAILTRTTASGVRGNSDITFLLDNQATYFLRDAPTSNIKTAQTIFSAIDLTDQDHTLNIINGRSNSSFIQMVMLLDSIIYTTTSLQDDDIPSQVKKDNQRNRTPSNSTILIIVAISAGVGGVTLGLLASWLYLRVRARKVQVPQSHSSPPNNSQGPSTRQIVPFPAYKPPSPPCRSEPFDARGSDIESQSPQVPPASPHRPETVFSMVPPSYRSRSAASAS